MVWETFMKVSFRWRHSAFPLWRGVRGRITLWLIPCVSRCFWKSVGLSRWDVKRFVNSAPLSDKGAQKIGNCISWQAENAVFTKQTCFDRAWYFLCQYHYEKLNMEAWKTVDSYWVTVFFVALYRQLSKMVVAFLDWRNWRMNNKNFLKYDTNRSFHSLYEVKRRKSLKMVVKWKKEIVLIIFINA